MWKILYIRASARMFLSLWSPLAIPDECSRGRSSQHSSSFLLGSLPKLQCYLSCPKERCVPTSTLFWPHSPAKSSSPLLQPGEWERGSNTVFSLAEMAVFRRKRCRGPALVHRPERFSGHTPSKSRQRAWGAGESGSGGVMPRSGWLLSASRVSGARALSASSSLAKNLLLSSSSVSLFSLIYLRLILHYSV